MDKVYSVLCDVSPSEQLTTELSEVKYLAMLIGLKYRKSLDDVGLDYHDSEQRFHLKKWSKSSKSYKEQFPRYAEIWKRDGRLLYGIQATHDKNIFLLGGAYFERSMGAFPEPSSYSLSGKPRIMMGGLKVDDKVVSTYEVLIDDLCVLGWYVEALESFRKELMIINSSENITLEVLIDNLPNEQGDSLRYKAVLLKHLMAKVSNGKLRLMGTPEVSDARQRDLMADNLAGFAREHFKKQGDVPGLFDISRINTELKDMKVENLPQPKGL